MFINILENTDERRCFSNPAVMNTYLMLYKKSIDKENITSWNGTSITLPVGQTVSSKYYIATVFKCSIDKAKNYLKTLVRNGLIRIEYNQNIKQNVITIPAVNPSPGTKYVQMQLPTDNVEEIYKNRCKYLSTIYMYLTLHARKQNGTSYYIDGEVLRGEFVDTLHSIASVCGCCVKTVSNVLANLKKKGLLVFETIKKIAMKVKLLLYPSLKVASKKVNEVVKSFVTNEEKKNGVTLAKEVAEPSKLKNEEQIIQTSITEDVKYLLFDRKRNNNVSTLNNVIVEVEKAVEAIHFPLDKLRKAFDALYDKNKKEGDKQITASVIISFLKDYQEKRVLLENEKNVLSNDLKKISDEIDTTKKNIEELDSSWRLVADAEEEVKAKGQLISFSSEEICTMYYLLQPITVNINGCRLLKPGEQLSFLYEDLAKHDEKSRSESWDSNTVAQAVLLERLLQNEKVSKQALREAYWESKVRLESFLKQKQQLYAETKRAGEVRIQTMLLR